MDMVYTPAEVAEMLKVKTTTITEHLRKGTLKGFKVGTRWRITERALADFMQEEDGEIKKEK